MNFRLAPFMLCVLCISTLSACSRKVTWEEEVPLNTGEVIWVKRSIGWQYSSGYGNPFDFSMSPTGERTTRFQYGRKEYIYSGEANILLLAISPQGIPTLIARAVDNGWASTNNYTCVTPYYVQLLPNTTGNQWIWPEKIEPWLYDLPANLMINAPDLDESRVDRYSINDRNERDQVFRVQSPSGSKVDPLYMSKSGCIHKYDPNFKPS